MNEDGRLRLEKKDFETIYKLADAVVSTQTGRRKNGTDIKTQETVAAQAILDTIDYAIEDELEFLIFEENEVIFLANVI